MMLSVFRAMLFALRLLGGVTNISRFLQRAMIRIKEIGGPDEIAPVRRPRRIHRAAKLRKNLANASEGRICLRVSLWF